MDNYYEHTEQDISPNTEIHHEMSNENSMQIIGDVIDVGNTFNFDGYQVVRREFFAHLYEPALTFNNNKIYVNSACLKRLPDVDYVTCLVNKEDKIIAFEPVSNETKDSFAWCSIGSKKRKPKQISCRIFYHMIASAMGWNPSYRYKILGQLIRSNGKYLMAFDLSSYEMYKREFPEGEKQKNSRIPVFPEGWKDQFGLPYKNHKESMKIDIFDGYAVYSIRDDKQLGKQTHENAGAEKVQETTGTAVGVLQEHTFLEGNV